MKKLITPITDDKNLNGSRSATGVGSDGKRYRVSIDAGGRVLLNGGRFGKRYGTRWFAHRLCLDDAESRWENLGKVPRSYSLTKLLP